MIAKLKIKIFNFLKKIKITEHFRDVDSLFAFLLESSYAALPFPIRMIVSETVYVEFLNKNKQAVIDIIWVKCGGCGAEKVRNTKCYYCGSHS